MHIPDERQRLQVVFTFLVIFAGVLSLARPDPAPAQAWFRLGVALAGCTGLVVLWARGRR